MAPADSPAWRRAFDSVERRVASPLESATSSPDFQVAAQTLRSAGRAIGRPINGVVAWGLHLAGLPAHADMRALTRQLGDVQRELLAIRRDLANADRERREGE